MTDPRPGGRENGFTLIEVMAAMLISTFVILTLSNLFIHATHQVSQARDDTGTAVYAQDKLEELLQANRGSDVLNAGVYTDNPAEGYVREWTIYDNNPAPGSKLISVKVTPRHGLSKRPCLYVGIRAR